MNKVSDLEAALGHRFKDQSLLLQSLTHPSLDGSPHYQRLEFLGDRVVGLVIAEALYEMFPEEREGSLSRRLAYLVRRETLGEIALEVGLAPHIRMAENAEAAGGRENPALLSDIIEAVIAALYKEGGFALARDFVLRHWQSRLTASGVTLKDAKSALQEWAQGRGLNTPTYKTVDRSGPDHDPTFRISVEIPGLGSAEAEGSAKRDAEQEAAGILLEELLRKDPQKDPGKENGQ
ncbi:MAG: ribonuclease III [Proteobacteria bacterium]|nr:ribonuclease III [Pseudomonadota bacterium]